MPTKRDKNHKALIDAMRNRCGGYWRDENGAHHANLMGLTVDAYDMHKAGSGFPDWIMFISWLAISVEIKNPERTISKRAAKQGKRAYIHGRFTDDEQEFARNFHGLRVVGFEQNELYDMLCDAARFVLAIDDMISGHDKPEPLPADFVKVFFNRHDNPPNWSVRSVSPQISGAGI